MTHVWLTPIYVGKPTGLKRCFFLILLWNNLLKGLGNLSKTFERILPVKGGGPPPPFR